MIVHRTQACRDTTAVPPAHGLTGKLFLVLTGTSTCVWGYWTLISTQLILFISEVSCPRVSTLLSAVEQHNNHTVLLSHSPPTPSNIGIVPGQGVATQSTTSQRRGICPLSPPNELTTICLHETTKVGHLSLPTSVMSGWATCCRQIPWKQQVSYTCAPEWAACSYYNALDQQGRPHAPYENATKWATCS